MEIRELRLGERIAEGRALRRFTQAQLAQATSMDRSALAKIETGQRRVSALELANIADALDLRIDWFTSPSPPAMVSHRNMADPGAANPTIDSKLEELVRDVLFVSEQRPGLLRGAPVPVAAPNSNADAEKLAREAREILGVPQEAPLPNLASTLAAVSLLAFSFDLGDQAADAATVLLDHGAVTLINGHLSVGRRRIALAHELCHYLVADDYTIDWRVSMATKANEREAAFDRFARSLLLPSQGLDDAWRQNSEHGLRLAAVRTASVFQVDMATLARRLEELGLATHDECGEIRQVRTTKADIVEWGLHVPHELEPTALPGEFEKGVLELYRRELISQSRALELLHNSYEPEDLPPLAPTNAAEIWQITA